MTPTYTNGTNGILRPSTRSLGKPSASYPGSIATDQHLAIAVDRQQTTLAVAMGITDTSMTLASAAQIVTWSLLSIDNEIVQVNGPPTGNVVPITRAFDGTVAAIHVPGTAVTGLIDAYHHNTLVAEVEAIENALGTNLSKVPSTAFVLNTGYQFTPQTPGGSLTPGTNAITLSPVPAGVNGSNANHYLYISGGTGTAEAVPITGGSAVSGAPSGQIFVTCANAHSGAWTIQTATGGIQEALYSTGNAVQVIVVDGNYTIHAPTTIPGTNYEVHGSMAGSVLNVASDFQTSFRGVFVVPSTSANAAISGLTINFIQPDSSNISTYTHWPPAFYLQDAPRPVVADIFAYRAWDVISAKGNTGGMIVRNVQTSHFDIGIDIDGALDSIYLINIRFWPYSLTTNQMAAFNASPTYTGLNCARCDDLNISDFFCDGPMGLHLYQSASGSVTGHAVNVTLDSVSTLKIDSGYMSFANVFISMTTFDRIAIQVAANSFVRITGLCLYSGPNIGTAQPWISQTGGDLQIDNSWLWSGLDHTTVSLSGGRLVMTGCLFTKNVGGTYTQPVVNVSGTGRISFIGNRITDLGAGTGVFLNIPADNWHQVRDNVILGWGMTLPSTPSSGVYEGQGDLYYPLNVRALTLKYLNSPLSGIFWGSGAPNGTVTASRGSIYLNTNGAAGTTLYVKETGDNTNTGWTAK